MRIIKRIKSVIFQMIPRVYKLPNVVYIRWLSYEWIIKM